jgi:hypothetical protein
MLAPIVYKAAKPVFQHLWNKYQQGRTQGRGEGVDSEDVPTAQAWEWYLRAGSNVSEQHVSASEDASRAQAKGRAVDLSSPRSVLNLPAEGRLTQALLQRAFRRELLLWHPDHNQHEQRAQQAEATTRTQAILGAYGALKSQAI